MGAIALLLITIFALPLSILTIESDKWESRRSTVVAIDTTEIGEANE